MIRTAIACAALAAAAYAAAAHVTHDFQVWTAEGARRLEVSLDPVAAPSVRVEGPEVAPGTRLADLLSGGHAVTIVDFVYTRCETVCLSLGGTFQQLQSALAQDGGAAPVRLLSVSFDPRDSVDDLRAYASRLHAGPSWHFVRVQEAGELARLLEAYRVTVVPRGPDFEHNAALLVVDARGRLVRVFDIAEQQLAMDYARHLAKAAEP